jgi:hypothetical protein
MLLLLAHVRDESNSRQRRYTARVNHYIYEGSNVNSEAASYTERCNLIVATIGSWNYYDCNSGAQSLSKGAVNVDTSNM